MQPNRIAPMLALAVVFTAQMLTSGAARAQEYPDRPVKMIVPLAAGAATDTVARSLSERLAKRLHQPMIVENKTGAGGNIAYDFTAKSAPDGYTLLFAPTGIATNATLYKNLPYDVRKDFTPVGLVVKSSHIMVVRPSLKVRTMAEFIDYAKRSKGINCGHSGNGTILHLACEMFRTRTDTPLQSIAYRGGTLAMADLLAGNIDLMFVDISVGLPQVKAGKIIALATTGPDRIALLPDVPTVSEAGLPGFAIESWFGVFAPAGLPAPILDRLSREIRTVQSDQEFRQRMTDIGQDTVTSTPTEFSGFVKEQIDFMGNLVRASGASAD